MIEQLARIPDAELPPPDVGDSVAYLASEAALASLAVDGYWPKWHSPWWHMLLLFELGEARRIPERTARAMVDALNRLPVKIFPIHPGELPAGADPARHTQCHCALGSMIQVLHACGLDPWQELPWIAPWFDRYQMADGGLSCDESAYLVAGECPSSMVGTVAPLEAMLLRPPGGFAARAAAFLIDRELRKGSASVHNCEERQREPEWLQPCFPRFYFYDVIRGAAALTRWAELAQQPIPRAAIERVAVQLCAAYPDGVVRLERQAFARAGTWMQDAAGTWTRRPAATRFPLLEATSRPGDASSAVTRQWAETRRGLLRLHEQGLIDLSRER